LKLKSVNIFQVPELPKIPVPEEKPVPLPKKPEAPPAKGIGQHTLSFSFFFKFLLSLVLLLLNH